MKKSCKRGSIFSWIKRKHPSRNPRLKRVAPSFSCVPPFPNWLPGPESTPYATRPSTRRGNERSLKFQQFVQSPNVRGRTELDGGPRGARREPRGWASDAARASHQVRARRCGLHLAAANRHRARPDAFSVDSFPQSASLDALLIGPHNHAPKAPSPLRAFACAFRFRFRCWNC